jgi:hypothetical protein
VRVPYNKAYSSSGIVHEIIWSQKFVNVTRNNIVRGSVRIDYSSGNLHSFSVAELIDVKGTKKASAPQEDGFCRFS